MQSKCSGPYGWSPELRPPRPGLPRADARLLTAKAKAVVDTAATRYISEGLRPYGKAPMYLPPAQARLLIAKATVRHDIIAPRQEHGQPVGTLGVAKTILPHPPMEKARPHGRRTVQEKAKPIRLTLAPMTKATLHAMMAVKGLQEPQLQLALSDEGRSHDGRDGQ